MENNELTITFRKISDNIKRYFWILIITLFCGIAISVILSLNSNEYSETEYEIQKVYAIHSTNEAEKDTSSSSDILSDILLMSDTKVFSSIIENEMESEGYKDFVFSMDNIRRSISGNVIIFNFRGNDAQEVESLASIYSVQMAENMSSFLDGKEIILEDDLSEGTARPVSVDNSDNNLVSVKNIFIICLSLLFGFIIIFFLTIFDKYARNINEISGLENAAVLGTVKKNENNRLSFVKTAYCIKEYIESNNAKQIFFMSVTLDKNKKKMIDELMEETSKYISNNVEIEYFSNILENYEKIDQIKRGNVIFFLCVNADKRRDVEEGISLLKIAGKEIGAVVYID